MEAFFPYLLIGTIWEMVVLVILWSSGRSICWVWYFHILKSLNIFSLNIITHSLLFIFNILTLYGIKGFFSGFIYLEFCRILVQAFFFSMLRKKIENTIHVFTTVLSFLPFLQSEGQIFSWWFRTPPVFVHIFFSIYYWYLLHYLIPQSWLPYLTLCFLPVPFSW